MKGHFFSDLAILAQKWSIIAAWKKILGLWHPLLMDLGQDEQHHPT